MDNQPPPRQRKTRIGSGAASTPSGTEYIYHWNRIIAAVVVLLLIAGLLGLGIRAWLSDPTPAMASGNAGLDAVEAPVTDSASAPRSGNPEVGGAEPQPAPSESVQAPQTASPPEEVPPREAVVPERLEIPETAQDEPSTVFLPPDTRVNLRADPSLSSPVLRILEPGTELELLDIGGDFYQVRSDAGIVGWVSREYSSVTPYPASVP